MYIFSKNEILMHLEMICLLNGIRGAYEKIPDFFRMSTFIDSK